MTALQAGVSPKGKDTNRNSGFGHDRAGSGQKRSTNALGPRATPAKLEWSTANTISTHDVGEYERRKGASCKAPAWRLPKAQGKAGQGKARLGKALGLGSAKARPKDVPSSEDFGATLQAPHLCPQRSANNRPHGDSQLPNTVHERQIRLRLRVTARSSPELTSSLPYPSTCAPPPTHRISTGDDQRRALAAPATLAGAFKTPRVFPTPLSRKWPRSWRPSLPARPTR